MFDLSDYLPYLLNRAANRITASADGEFQRFGITLQGWRVMASLFSRDGQRISDLSVSTSIEISTVSRLVDALESQGLVEKRRERPRSRTVSAHVTRKGRNLVTRMVPSAQKTETNALEGLSDEETAVLKKALRAIYDNIVALEDEARSGREAG